MKRIISLGVLAVAAVITLIGGVDNVARGQDAPPPPKAVTAANGSIPGRVVVSWDAVPDAAFYRIGWVAMEDYNALPDQSLWLEIFRFVDIGNRGQTSYTITRLTPGIEYSFIVATNDTRYGAPAWSSWATLTLTAAPATAVQPAPSGTPLSSSQFSSSELKYQAIDAGKDHTCGINLDNTVECWGDNIHGQTNAPEGQFLSISAGGVYSCGINFDNQLQCWGHAAIPSPPDGDYTHVSVGDDHACAITVAVDDQNRILCWGLPNSDGRTQNQATARAWNGIAVGSDFSCAILPDSWRGTHCWGVSPENYGFDRRHTGSYRDLRDISAGAQHICGLYDDAFVVCRGNDVHKQVSGIPNAQDEGAAADFYTYGAVSAGGRHSCGLRTTGNIRCWGDNLRGQAMPPGGNDELQANQEGVGDFTAVSAGDAHTCGLRRDGTAVCWGLNDHGQAAPR